MRLIFMGTGPFAEPTLRHLYQSAHRVAAVVTQPERPAHGRRGAAKSPVRLLAEEHGTPILDPLNVNDAEAQASIRRFEPDLLVVADYGQILSAGVVALAAQGAINLHGSLLPKYRGAAPVNWALYHGETETGVSVFHITPRVDAGPILAQARLAIDPDETAVELEARLAELGAPLVCRVVDDLAAGRTSAIDQDPESASRARRLRKSDGIIHWSRSAVDIKNQVRALKPWPGTFTYWHREGASPLRLILDRVEPVEFAADEPPGTVLEAGDGRFVVATGEGELAILSVQPAGKRTLSAAEFLRGYHVRRGDRLGPSEE